MLFDRFFSSAPRRQRLEPHVRHQRAGRATRTTTICLSRAAIRDTPTIFDRLQSAGVSWRYYVKDYDPTNTIDNPGAGQRQRRSSSQVPLLAMPRFVRSPQALSHIVDLEQFYSDAQSGRLPAVVLHRARRPQRAPARAS